MKTCQNCQREFNSRQATCSPKCGNESRSKKAMANFNERKKRFAEIWNSLQMGQRGQYIAALINVSYRTVETWFYNNSRAIPEKRLRKLEEILCSN
jgi:uncharacterized membrane protein YvbJ